jgi:hypothetical protein
MSDANIHQSKDFVDTINQAAAEKPVSHSLLGIIKSAEKTPLAPAINSLAIEPLNFGISILNSGSKNGAWLVNKVFGTEAKATSVKPVDTLALGKSEPGSPNYYSQHFFDGAASLLAVAATGTVLGKARHVLTEAGALEAGIKEVQASAGLRSLTSDSQKLGTVFAGQAVESSNLSLSVKNETFTPINEIINHVRSSDSAIGRTFNGEQTALLDSFEKAYNLANLDSVAIENRMEFSKPTILNDPPHMKDAVVTAITTYENGVRVYENPTGIKAIGRPDAYNHATRWTTDDKTFIKKEWGGKLSFLDGVGSGASVESVIELPRSGTAFYINEAGLYGQNSERVLLQDMGARIRLFDKTDEVKALQTDSVFDSHVQKIVDTFGRIKNDVLVDDLLAQINVADRPVANAIMDTSASAISGHDLMKNLRELGQQATEWWESNAQSKSPLEPVHPAADKSADAFSYLANKVNRQIQLSNPVHYLDKGNKKHEALMLFGDMSKVSPVEVEKLKELRASGVPIAVFDNSFARGINSIDLVKGTAKEKLDGLIDAVKTKQSESNLTAAEAARAVIRDPAQKLAQDLDAKLLGENLPTQSTSSESLVGHIKASLEKQYPFGDDRTAIAKVLADELRFYDLPEMLGSFKTLHHFVDEASGSNALYVVGERGKSQGLINHLYQEVNGLNDSQFVTTDQLEALPKAEIKGKTLVLLDDAAYTGDQLEKNTAELQEITGHDQPVIVANLAAYQQAYANTQHIDGMQITSLESITPFYQIKSERVNTRGFSNGMYGATTVDSAKFSLKPEEIEAKRRESLFEFNHGLGYRKLANRLIFFYKQTDSTPKFIKNILDEHFGIKF